MAKKKSQSGKKKRALANPAGAEHFAKLRRLAKRTCKTGKPAPAMDKRAVHPYVDPVQKPVEYDLKTREYHMPFNYKNIVHKVHMSDPANAGLELGSVNSAYRKEDGGTRDDLPSDCLELTEKTPIVRILGGCAQPGWTEDACPNDNHYAFRIIRTTVVVKSLSE